MEHRLVFKYVAGTQPATVSPIAGFLLFIIFQKQRSSVSLRCDQAHHRSWQRTPSCLKKAFCLVQPPQKKKSIFGGYLSTDLWCFSVVRVSQTETVFSTSALQLLFLDMSGSHRKNSWRSVLTVSGHSIMTMWLPSSMTLRNANRRI